ncbi:UNVERIFIED_CONTAM: hypothetical protein FKN15_075038 [Acipenser sinensis]
MTKGVYCYIYNYNQTSTDLPTMGMPAGLLSNCDGQLKAEIAQMAAYYEHRLQLGNKAIYHLEAFVTKCMAIYKKWMDEAMMF